MYPCLCVCVFLQLLVRNRRNVPRSVAHLNIRVESSLYILFRAVRGSSCGFDTVFCSPSVMWWWFPRVWRTLSWYQEPRPLLCLKMLYLSNLCAVWSRIALGLGKYLGNYLGNKGRNKGQNNLGNKAKTYYERMMAQHTCGKEAM